MNSSSSKMNSLAAKIVFGFFRWFWRYRNWTFGSLLILVAISGLSSSIPGALLCALAGVVLFPPVRNGIAEKTGKDIVRNDFAAYAVSFIIAVTGTTFISAGIERQTRDTLLAQKTANLGAISQLIDELKFNEAKTELDRYLKYLPSDKDVLVTKGVLVEKWVPALITEIDAALQNENFPAAEKSLAVFRTLAATESVATESLKDVEDRFAVASKEYASKQEQERKEAAALQAAINECKQNYRSCADNEMVVNHYGGTSGAQVSCKMEAEKMANYGDPDWTWPNFSTFFVGRDAVETGTLRLVDNDVKFQNAFGAYQRTPLECHYDLDAKEVLFVRAQ